MKGENQSSSCNIHPIEFIEGVCPLCLNERLLVLVSLQRLRPPPPSPSYHTIQEPKNILRKSSKKKNIRVFSFFGFFELRHHKSNHETTSIVSPEGTIAKSLYLFFFFFWSQYAGLNSSCETINYANTLTKFCPKKLLYEYL